MSKVNNVRLPNANPREYSAEQFNQLVRSLEQVIFQLNNTYTPTVSDNASAALTWMATGNGGSPGFSAGVRGPQISNGISLPYAMLLSSFDQANAGPATTNVVSYDPVVLANGITVELGSRIRVPCGGQYLVTFSLQVTNRSNTVAEFEVWARDTGVDYPLSNTRFDVPARKSSGVWSHIAPAVSGIFTVDDPATNYLELAWWSDNIDVFLENYPAPTGPARPAIPSVILTINFISAA